MTDMQLLGEVRYCGTRRICTISAYANSLCVVNGELFVGSFGGIVG